MKIAIIIVLYQKRIDASIAFNSISSQNVDVIFFDNSLSSDITNFNMKYADENSLKYYSLNKNVGLSKAYNYVIENEKYDFYITSDDDTKYPENYIDIFLKDFNNEILVFFPKIKGINGKEHKKSIYRSKYTIREIPLKLKDRGYYNFINSGAFYNKVVFENVKFNELLFVECIDNDMCDKLKNHKIRQKELNTTLIQNFSTLKERCDENNGRLNNTYNDIITYYGSFAYFHELLHHTYEAIKNQNLSVFTAFWKIYVFKNKKI